MRLHAIVHECNIITALFRECLFRPSNLLSLLLAAETVAKKVHKLQGVELKIKFAECVRECDSKGDTENDTLEVRNLPKNASKDYLELYFESPKSGGCTDGVKEVRFVKPGVARVLFKSPRS